MTVDYIKSRPMDSLRFGDFVSLKSGRDKFSKLKLPELTKESGITPEEYDVIVAKFGEEAEQAKVLRWILRGLPIEKAIRKVATDREVTENAIAAKEGHHLERWDRQFVEVRKAQAEFQLLEAHENALEENERRKAGAA